MSKVIVQHLNKIKIFVANIFSKREYVYYHIFFVLFALLFIGRSIDFNFLTHYINGMDTYQWLNFDNFLRKSLFVWNPDSSGKMDPMVFTPFFYNLILKIIYSITDHLILSVNIYWVLFIYFLEISFFYFYQIFLSGKKALLATMLSFLNIKMITTLYAPTISVNIALAAFPLMFFLLHSYIFKKKFIYAFLFIVFQIILFRVLNVLILANIFVPILLFLLFRDEILDKKVFFKKLILIWIFSLLACSMSIINLGMSFNNVSNNSNVQAYNEASMSSFYTDRGSLLNIFRLTNHFSLADDKPEFPGFLFFKFSNLYMESGYFIVVSFLFFGLLLANFIKNRKNRKIITIMVCIVSLIFLAKTFNPPWEFINQWLYSNTFYMMFFRSGSKYFMYFIMPLAILIMFIGHKKFKLFYLLIFLYVFSHAFLIFFYAKPIAHYWNTILLNEYLETTKKINSLNDNNKILVLPISPRLAGSMNYDDGYAGYDRLQLLSSKTFVSKNAAWGGSDEYNKIYNSIADEMNVNHEMIDKNASTLNYRYVIIEKDAVYYPKLDFNSAIKSSNKIEKNLNKKIWKKIFDNKKFSLYKIKDEDFVGKIDVSSHRLSFKGISPVKYEAKIQNLDSNSQLSFLEAYNPGWKLYLKPISSDEECTSVGNFSDNRVTECQYENKVYELEDLFYFWKNSIFDNTHRVINQYANSWSIDTNHIRQNFSKEYYIENPDGSIDVKMVIFFKPQASYYLGLIISGLTIMGCFGYMLYNWNSRRKI